MSNYKYTDMSKNITPTSDPLDLILVNIPNVIIPKNSVLELELRLSVDKRTNKINKFDKYDTLKFAKKLIEKYKNNKAELHQSINFIKNNNDIKQVVFVNGIQEKKLNVCYHKHSLLNNFVVLGSLPYKIKLSYEEKLDEISMEQCSLARFRNRYSIYLNNWRLDITLIKNLLSLSNSDDIKKIRSSFIYELDINQFIERAPWEKADWIEVEIEYIAKLNTSNDNSDNSEFLQHMHNELKYIDDEINNMIDSKYEDNFADSVDNNNNMIDSLSDMDDYQKYMYIVATYINPKSAKRYKNKFTMQQLSNRVIELNKNTFIKKVLNHITDYYITAKTDGTRSIIYVNNDKIHILTNDVEIIYTSDKSDNDKIEKNNNKSDTNNNIFIFDCEKYKINKEDNKPSEYIYYIFDVMVWKNENITNNTFEFRKQYFTEATKLFSFIKEKAFVKLTNNFKEEIKNIHSDEFETDGIVFTPYDGKYIDMEVFKYKPLDKITIDFLIKKCPQNLVGVNPFVKKSKSDNVYILFCGLSRSVFFRLKLEFVKNYGEIFKTINTRNLPHYFPFQFTPSDNQFAYIFNSVDDSLDGKVAEMSYATGKWKILKFREDKQADADNLLYFGNNYKVAEETWLNYQNPLSIETDDFKDVYFQVNNNDLYKELRNYNSFIKTQLYKNYKNYNYVMDMAAGKGQDFFRYGANKIASSGAVLFVDNDKTALMELIHRKFDFANNREYEGQKLHVLTHWLNLNNNYKDNIDLLENDLILPVNKFDLIICNFAFHYFVNNMKQLENIINFIDYYLKSGGRFVFTAFDGSSISKLLISNKGEWQSADKKYHIIKQYTTNDLLPIGQKIKLLLPFSNGEYYVEPLVNIEFISKKFAEKGINLEINESFLDHASKYGNRHRLTDDDFTFIGLYHYYSFYKK